MLSTFSKTCVTLFKINKLNMYSTFTNPVDLLLHTDLLSSPIPAVVWQYKMVVKWDVWCLCTRATVSGVKKDTSVD